MWSTNLFNSFFKNILLYMNSQQSKMCSVHTYVMPLLFWFNQTKNIVSQTKVLCLKVGCAAVELKNGQTHMMMEKQTLLICYYAPSWHIKSFKQQESIYQIGKPCSGCSSEEKCKFGALCTQKNINGNFECFLRFAYPCLK